MKKKELYEILDWIFQCKTRNPVKFDEIVYFKVYSPKYLKEYRWKFETLDVPEDLIHKFIIERAIYYGSKKY